MSTQKSGDRTALVVIDVQNAVVENAWDRDGVVSRIATLIGRARDEDVPVLFVQHEEPASDDLQPGTDGWKFVDQIAPRAGEAVIAKQYNDAFEETTLPATLEQLGVGHLVITGAQTDACVRATYHRSLVEGYDVTLVADCHTTDDRAFDDMTISAEQIVAHTNMYAQYTSYPGRRSRVVSQEDVAFHTVGPGDA
jgi:nicotinamidase-related amidase